ncbi:MAG: hypothetical protein GXO86_09900 [Chlorobi bacterium]|nr:hypothetical protein [Chlorobiota bacterium]
MKFKLLLILFILSLAVYAQDQENESTLADLQKQYTGEQVIVKTLFVRNGKQFDWNEAKRDGDHYVYEMLKYLPVSYIGREAEIIAIQLNKKEREEINEKTNAFGEKFDIKSIINPYFEIVVKFSDGKIALTTAYQSTLDYKIELVSHLEVRKKELADFVSLITGDTLYATSISRIFKPVASIGDMLSNNNFMKARDFPRLEPLIIEATKFITQHNVIILKLKDPKNRIYLSYSDAENEIYLDDYKNLLETIANDIKMITIIPDCLTEDEIKAIKIGACFKGMSVMALHFSIGFPDKEKKYSTGGNQLIYGDWLNIRLDNQNDHIISCQIIDN